MVWYGHWSVLAEQPQAALNPRQEFSPASSSGLTRDSSWGVISFISAVLLQALPGSWLSKVEFSINCSHKPFHAKGRLLLIHTHMYHYTVLHNHGLVIIIVGPLCGVLHNHFITLIAPLPGVDLSDAGRDHGALHSSTGSVRPVSRTPFKPTSWSTVILTISDNYHR